MKHLARAFNRLEITFKILIVCFVFYFVTRVAGK